MMNKTGAWLAVHALEQLGIRWTFGIPGVHNTELYDELDRSSSITPVLVTHEGGGAFMADAISRTSDTVGCLAIVPAAGMTHALSGIGEAFLDGVPMLVISGGVRRDTGRHYQLHAIDQQRMLESITKAAVLVREHSDVVPAIYRAYELATSGEPGPVFVELAGDVLMFVGDVQELPEYRPSWRLPELDESKIAAAAELLAQASKPGLYLGWGAREATAAAMRVAELLGAPVATTLQGLSVFPADHPLHVGMGFGASSVPAARKAFEGCDGLLAVGARFAELATGSYGMPIPQQLVHIDINPEVFDKNYPATVALEADAGMALEALAKALEESIPAPAPAQELRRLIAAEKRKFHSVWTGQPSADRVSPGIFFDRLRGRLDRDAFMVVDDGNHTFLAAEQFPVYESKRFISPTDFNCMGYCVPAAIGVKLANPRSQVVGIAGDGGFLMTGMEIVTAVSLNLGVVLFVFSDGELAQISQFQQIPLNRKTCTVLGTVRFDGLAAATGAGFVRMANDAEVEAKIEEALGVAAQGRPVIVDVNIDYSRKTAFTRGVVKTNLARFPLRQKLRFIGRAIKRHTIG